MLVPVDVDLGQINIAVGPEIDRLENPPLNGQHLRGETKLGFLQAGSAQDFRHVPLLQHRISREILRDLDKTGFEGRLSARPADAGFSIADNPRRAIDHSGFEQWPQRQIGCRRIAAGVGN